VFAASAIVNDPTDVSGAPTPSVSVIVATVPLIDSELSVPPEGTAASVQGAVPAV
jgi:hypothetical protein